MSKQFEKNQRIYWRQIFPRILSSNIAYCFAVNLSAATQLSSSTYHCSKVITSLNELLNKKRKVYWRWQRKWKIHWWLLYLVWIHLKQILAPFVGGAFFVFVFFFFNYYLFILLSFPLKSLLQSDYCNMAVLNNPSGLIWFCGLSQNYSFHFATAVMCICLAEKNLSLPFSVRCPEWS